MLHNVSLRQNPIADHLAGQARAKLKRNVKWRVFGFDPSTTDIADPWESRNFWFQQLTHSVRFIKSVEGPCILKVSSPSTWPSILETTAKPSACQFTSSLLSYHRC